MQVLVVNNTTLPAFVDIVGNDDPKHIHVIGSKAKSYFDIDTARLETLKQEFKNKLSFKIDGGK